MPCLLTTLWPPMNHSFPPPLVWSARRNKRFLRDEPSSSYLLSASISSSNWQTIISLFASHVPFQQARLSHYGGGKSSSIEVETLLVFSPFLGSELGMNPPLQSQTTILFFLMLFQHISVCYFDYFCLGLLHGSVSLLLPAGNVLCMVERSQHGSECSPLFLSECPPLNVL